MGFFAVLAASLFFVFLFTVFGGYSLLLWCQQSLWMIVPPALVLAVLIWTFLKMDDKITALQKRVDELEAAQKPSKSPRNKYNAALTGEAFPAGAAHFLCPTFYPVGHPALQTSPCPSLQGLLPAQNRLFPATH